MTNELIVVGGSKLTLHEQTIRQLASCSQDGARWLLYVGDEGEGRQLMDRAFSPTDHFEFLGPSEAEFTPFWWWSWALGALFPQGGQITLCWSEEDILRVCDLSDGPNAQNLHLIHAWRHAAKSSLGAAGPFCLSWRLVVELLDPSVAPKAARVAALAVRRYIVSYLQLVSSIFLSPNVELQSQTLSTADGNDNCLFNLMRELNDLESARMALVKSIGKDGERFVEIIKSPITTLHAPGKKTGERDERARRLVVFSAWFYARGMHFFHEGRWSECLTSAFRSAEVFAHAVLVKDGKLMWRNQKWTWDLLSGLKGAEVTAESLFSQATALGFLDPKKAPFQMKLNDLRVLRNRQIWGHGLVGADEKSASDALALVLRAVAQYSATVNPWQAHVDELRHLQSLSVLPGVLLAQLNAAKERLTMLRIKCPA